MAPTPDEPGVPWRILCVCTGNVCRSPAAERLLATALGPSVIVGSAGTSALIGRPIEPPMAALVAAAGADVAGFVARDLTEALLREADVVLTLTRDHRRAAVELAPAVVRRTFTLREYARLLGDLDPAGLPVGTPAQRARAAAPTVSAGRRPGPVGQDDIADPYRRGDAAYAVAFAEIRRAVDRIAAVLAPG